MRQSKWHLGQSEVFILTDLLRAPDIANIIKTTPHCVKIIIRNPNFDEYSKDLSKNHKNIIATIDTKTAIKNRLYGIHIPNKRLKYFRQSNRKGIFISASAHNGREICRALNLGIKNIIISPIFKSQSPSAKKTLGPIKLSILRHRFKSINFIALGGVNKRTIPRLGKIGILAIAGVSFNNGS